MFCRFFKIKGHKYNFSKYKNNFIIFPNHKYNMISRIHFMGSFICYNYSHVSNCTIQIVFTSFSVYWEAPMELKLYKDLGHLKQK